MANVDSSQELGTDALAPEQEELPPTKNGDAEVTEKDEEDHVDEKEDEEKKDDETKDAKTVEHGNDDDELDLSKYDGVCEKCEGRTRSDKDHIQDLIDRVLTSKKKYAALFLHRHWPHFSDYSRHMQFFCHVCKLHFKGAVPFTFHLHRNQTQEGFKQDGMQQITWTEEIGEKHKEDLAKFIKLIQCMNTEGPNVAQVPDIKEFLCARSPRYYEIACNTGSYDMADRASGEVSDDLMHLEYEMRKVLKENPEEYEVIDTEEVDNSVGPMAIQERLKKVFKGEIPRMFPLDEGENHAMETDDKETAEEKKKKEQEAKKTRNTFKCPFCNESHPSVRHHVNDFLWFEHYQQKDNAGRWLHISYFLNTAQGKSSAMVGTYNPERENCLICPVCSQHMCMRKGYQQIFFHLRRHGLSLKRKPTKFVRDHAELMNTLSDLFVDRIVGDISGDEVTAFFNKTFLCNEGGVYMGGVYPNDVMEKRKSKQKRQRESSASDSRGGKRFNPSMRGGQTGGPRMPMRGGGRSGFMGASAAPRGGPRGGRGGGPRMMRGGAREGYGCVCDLCYYEAPDMATLREHLVEALFGSNPGSHISCFPGPLIFSTPCVCAACGVRFPNFVACLSHMRTAAMMAGWNDRHMAESNRLVDQYMHCMSGSIPVSQVLSFIQMVYQLVRPRQW